MTEHFALSLWDFGSFFQMLGREEAHVSHPFLGRAVSDLLSISAFASSPLFDQGSFPFFYPELGQWQHESKGHSMERKETHTFWSMT